MITGVVKSDEGRIRLKVKGLRGREQEVEAVIDTGYTASLTFDIAAGVDRRVGPALAKCGPVHAG
jgi:hypothetical protein